MMIKSFAMRRPGPLSAIPVLLVIPLMFSGCQEQEESKAAPTTPSQSRAAAKSETPSKEPVVSFTDDGELKRPTGYRKWTYIGTPVTPNDMNDGKAPFPEFHSVYMDPDGYNHYEMTGEFPDGTVIVKELVSVGEKEATSGKGYFMGEFIGLEVSIKDKTRFKDEPANWAYFSFGHEYPLKEMAKAQPASSCNECHEGNAEDDWVFTQYYPVLRAAKGSAK
jgi:hypothetical protein